MGGVERAVELDDPGVASPHATLLHDPAAGYLLKALGAATLYTGGRSVHELRLRNGELFQLGGVCLQFRLRPAKARDWAWLELLSAAAVAACCVAEVLWILISPSWP